MKKVDEKATTDAVKAFFLSDEYGKKSYSHICRMANSYGLASPKLDPAGGSGHGGGNHQEDVFINYIAYDNAKKAIENAIESCVHENSQAILKARLQEHKGVEEVKSLLALRGESSYRRYERIACIEFFDALQIQLKAFHVEDLFPQSLVAEK